MYLVYYMYEPSYMHDEENVILLGIILQGMKAYIQRECHPLGDHPPGDETLHTCHTYMHTYVSYV
jgi:hypothetical protein